MSGRPASAPRMRDGPIETLACSCVKMSVVEGLSCNNVIMCGDHEEYEVLPHKHANLELFEKAEAAPELEETECEPGLTAPICFLSWDRGDQSNVRKCECKIISTSAIGIGCTSISTRPGALVLPSRAPALVAEGRSSTPGRVRRIALPRTSSTSLSAS